MRDCRGIVPGWLVLRGVGVDDGNGGAMVITISVGPKTLYMQGRAHHLSRAGCNRLLAWLFSNATLIRGWDYGEYVFSAGVDHAAN
jgi:hypothetical protein